MVDEDCFHFLVLAVFFRDKTQERCACSRWEQKDTDEVSFALGGREHRVSHGQLGASNPLELANFPGLSFANSWGGLRVLGSLLEGTIGYSRDKEVTVFPFGVENAP